MITGKMNGLQLTDMFLQRAGCVNLGNTYIPFLQFTVYKKTFSSCSLQLIRFFKVLHFLLNQICDLLMTSISCFCGTLTGAVIALTLGHRRHKMTPFCYLAVKCVILTFSPLLILWYFLLISPPCFSLSVTVSWFSSGALRAATAASTVLCNMFQYNKLHRDFRMVRHTDTLLYQITHIQCIIHGCLEKGT